MKLKPTPKFYLRTSLVIGVLLWLVKTLLEGLIIFAESSDVALGISENTTVLLEAFFFISFIIYYRLRIQKAESTNFVDLIWRVFAIGLVTTITALLIDLFNGQIADSKLGEDPYLGKLLLSIDEALISLFLISTFIVWKKLILYQKSKRLVIWWNIYEVTILASIFFNLTGLILQEHLVFELLYGAITIMALLLSANLKWVAYLNFKQKWKSILLILLITIYLFYFFMTVYVSPATETTFVDIKSLFVISLFTFLMFYSLFSLLVILFNLPTSSVFEKKMEEAINFQRLSQSIQQGENETQIFDILLSSSMSAVYADAGWIEIIREGQELELRSRNVSRVNISTLRAQIAQSKQRSILKSPLERSSETDRVLVTIRKSNFRSVLIIPMEIQGTISGYMYLLNELSDGFNKEMINIINTFVSQASISVENFRLLGEALENERYKEELNIAKSVQRALLPEKLEHDEQFEIHGFTQAAAEVGGDYYDTFKLGDHKFAVVIGDVSGKGTSAAFHMSQMKGIFQSLAQLNLSAKDFLVNANNALSQCLEKTSFITLSYFIIDTEKRTLEFSRAGHCPTLYYCKKESEARFFQNKGLGLGILRNEKYENFVEVNHMTFEKDDILVLYTDGISEAANEEMEEFGYDRLQNLLQQNYHYDPVMIQKIIIGKLYEFCGNKDLNDDYTMVVIKFK